MKYCGKFVPVFQKMFIGEKTTYFSMYLLSPIVVPTHSDVLVRAIIGTYWNMQREQT